MTDLKHIRQAAKIVTNEDGRTVIQIPVDVWEDLLTQIEINSTEVQEIAQHEQIKALLHDWEVHPDQDTLDNNWWDDFRKILKENPIHLPEHDSKLDEE